MKFSLKLIKENLDIYIAIFIYMSIFSFFILKDINNRSQINNIYVKEEFIPNQAIKIIKNSDINKIDIENLQQFEKTVGEFDQFIKQITYRLEFSALIKNGENVTEVRGIGIDTQSEAKNLKAKFTNFNGLSIDGFTISQIALENLIKNSQDKNNSLEMYIFNRDSADSKISLFPIKITAVFDGINEKILTVPLKGARNLLQTDQYDYAVIEFHDKKELIKLLPLIKNSLEQIGYKISDLNKFNEYKNINIFSDIYLLIMFAVAFLALRDNAILNGRVKKTKDTLLLYGWKKIDILKIFFVQNILPLILFLLIWLAISLYINYKFWYILMPIFILYLLVSLIFFVIQVEKK